MKFTLEDLENLVVLAKINGLEDVDVKFETSTTEKGQFELTIKGGSLTSKFSVDEDSQDAKNNIAKDVILAIFLRGLKSYSL